MTHLKFLAQRIFKKEALQDDKMIEMYDYLIGNNYKNEGGSADNLLKKLRLRCTVLRGGVIIFEFTIAFLCDIIT